MTGEQGIAMVMTVKSAAAKSDHTRAAAAAAEMTVAKARALAKEAAKAAEGIAVVDNFLQTSPPPRSGLPTRFSAVHSWTAPRIYGRQPPGYA